MKNLISIIPILLLILALCTTGCPSTSTVISTLEGVVSAAEIAIPVIGAATGLNSATSAAIVSYLQLVNVATAEAAPILASTILTSQQKAAQVAVLFSGIAAGCDCIPAGTPAEVVAVVQAVAQAVSNFLATLTGKPPVAVKLTAANRTALANIRIRSLQNAVNLKGVKK